MNLLNDIAAQGGIGTGGVLKATNTAAAGALKGGQQGLLDFISVVLQQGNAAGQVPNLQQVSAQIAQFLKANPSDQAGLQQLIATLQQATAGKPGILGQLTAQAVQSIQQQQPVEIQVANALGGAIPAEQLAALLNNGGENAIALDPKILAELQVKFDAFKQAGGEITAEALAQFKTDVIALLQDKGFDLQTISQYLNGFAKDLRVAAAKTPTVAEATQQGAPKSWVPETDKSAADAAAQKAEASTTSSQPAKPAPPGGLNNAAAPSLQTQQQQPAAAQVKTPAASNLALINSFATGDKSSFSGDFGQQGGFSQSGSGDASALFQRAGETTNPQGFVNYMSAAKGNASAMTQMVSLQIQRNAAAKIDTFTLQLDPSELGRLDVRLKFSRDGGVKAHLSVEKPETLALLQRDAAQLEKLLEQSGLDVDTGGLSFDLREQGQQAFERNARAQGDTDDAFAAHIDGDAAEKTLTAKIAVQAYGYITQDSVNIMV